MSRFAANFAAAGTALSYFFGEIVRWYVGGTGTAIEVTGSVERASIAEQDSDGVEAFAGRVVVRVRPADIGLADTEAAGIRDHVEVAVSAGSPAYARYVVESREEDAGGVAAFAALAIEPEQRNANT